MLKRNIEIIFNNGAVRQILLLPAAPLKITFYFDQMELTLNEKRRGEGVYVISDQKGFPGRDIGQYKSEVQQAPQDLSSSSHLKGYKQPSGGTVFKRSCNSLKEAEQTSVTKKASQVAHQPELIAQKNQSRIQLNGSKKTEGTNHHEKSNADENDPVIVDMTYFPCESEDDTVDMKDSEKDIVFSVNIAEPNELCDNQNNLQKIDKSSQCNMKVNRVEPNVPCRNQTDVKQIDKSNHCNRKVNIVEPNEPCENQTDLKQIDKSSQCNRKVSIVVLNEPCENRNDLKQIDKSSECNRKVNIVEPIEPRENQNNLKQIDKSSQCNRKIRGGHKRCEICLSRSRNIPYRAFFKYPKDPELCQKWVAACPRPFLLKKTPEQLEKSHYVCSIHFRKQELSRKLNSKCQRLIRPAIPSLCLPDLSRSGYETVSTLKRILNLSTLRDNLRNKFQMVADEV